jgi:hypothetical protein
MKRGCYVGAPTSMGPCDFYLSDVLPCSSRRPDDLSSHRFGASRKGSSGLREGAVERPRSVSDRTADREQEERHRKAKVSGGLLDVDSRSVFQALSEIGLIWR